MNVLENIASLDSTGFSVCARPAFKDRVALLVFCVVAIFIIHGFDLSFLIDWVLAVLTFGCDLWFAPALQPLSRHLGTPHNVVGVVQSEQLVPDLHRALGQADVHEPILLRREYRKNSSSLFDVLSVGQTELVCNFVCSVVPQLCNWSDILREQVDQSHQVRPSVLDHSLVDLWCELSDLMIRIRRKASEGLGDVRLLFLRLNLELLGLKQALFQSCLLSCKRTPSFSFESAVLFEESILKNFVGDRTLINREQTLQRLLETFDFIRVRTDQDCGLQVLFTQAPNLCCKFWKLASDDWILR